MSCGGRLPTPWINYSPIWVLRGFDVRDGYYFYYTICSNASPISVFTPTFDPKLTLCYLSIAPNVQPGRPYRQPFLQLDSPTWQLHCFNYIERSRRNDLSAGLSLFQAVAIISSESLRLSPFLYPWYMFYEGSKRWFQSEPIVNYQVPFTQIIELPPIAPVP